MTTISSLLCFHGHDVENAYSTSFHIIHETKTRRAPYHEADKCLKVWHLRMGSIELLCPHTRELKHKKFNYYI